MANIFAIHLETGNLTQFDSTSGAILAASAASKKRGNYGLELTGALSAGYGQKDFSKTTVYVGCWVKIDSTISLPSYGGITLGNITTNGFNSPYWGIINFTGSAGSPNQWTMPAGGTSSTNFSLGEWHWIVCKYVVDGSTSLVWTMWVDGTQIGTGTYTISAASSIIRTRIGDTDGTTPSGKYIYFDDIYGDDADYINAPSEKIHFIKKTPSSTTPKGASGNTVVNDAFGSVVSVGNIVIAVCSQYRSGGDIPGTVTFSDNDGNTWYIDKHEVIGYRGITVGHCYPKSAVALTITATCVDTGYCAIAAAEFSGVALGLTAGGSANNSSNGNSTQPTTNLIDVGAGNFLFIAALMWNNVRNFYLSSPWTMMHNDGSDTYANLDWDYYITSGDQTATWNYEYSTWASAGVAYIEREGRTLLGGASSFFRGDSCY